MNPKNVLIVFLFTSFTIANFYGQTVNKTNDPSISISKSELMDFNFNTEGNPSTKRFKIKFPGFPTVVVEGNTLNEKAISFLKRSKKGVHIQVYDIEYRTKDGKPLRVAPMLFRLNS